MMINLLLNLIILLLPFGELVRFPIFAHLYLRALDVLVFILAGLFIVKEPSKLVKFPGLLFFLAILVISNLAHPFNPQSASYLFRTLVYCSLIPYFLKPKPQFPKPNPGIIDFSLLVFVILGLVQYFYYPELRNLYYLGYDPHSYRWVGLFLDPNISSLLLVWIILYLRNRKEKLVKPLIILSLISLLLTYSRIGWLCLVIGWFYQSLKTKSPTFFVGILALLIGILFLPRYFGEGTNLLRTNSVSAKVESSRLVWQQLKNNPLLGIGFNNIHLLKDSQNQPVANNSLYGIDNSWLTVLVTGGLLGLGSLIALVIKIRKLSSKPQRVLGLVYLLHSLSVNSFFIPSIFMWFWVLFLTLHKPPVNSSR